MRTTPLATLFIAGLSAAVVAQHDARAAEPRPLGDVVTERPRDCKVEGRFTLPVIAWGADIVTVHAFREGYFKSEGLDVELRREDRFADQLGDYMRCETPFLRATVGMAMQAVDVTESSPKSAMRAIHQLSWSVGGDAIVVRDSVQRPADLCDARIAVQSYGPHVDYLYRVLSDACGGQAGPELVWTEELTADRDSPGEKFASDKSIDAATVIIPDALVLTSDGNVGAGSEGSVRGARILLSTKTANRVIADAYFVRNDWARKHPQLVEGFVRAMLRAEMEVRELYRARDAAFRELFGFSAGVLLDLEGSVDDAVALWADAETMSQGGNEEFFNRSSPRSFATLSVEAQRFFQAVGLIRREYGVSHASFDYRSLTGRRSERQARQRFDPGKTSSLASSLQSQGRLDDGTLFAFEINFKPNQKEFPIASYQAQFERVLELASTYGGALLIVEGHADPLNYLRKKKGGADSLVLKSIGQSARSLSAQRALSAQQSVIALGDQMNIPLDRSQFTISGAGLADPKTGMCGQDPCAPKTKAEWYSNMRVVFRVVQVEAESDVFVPLD